MKVKTEPEFKIGDWVVVEGSNYPRQFKRFTGDLPEWNKKLDYENVEFLNTSYKKRIPLNSRNKVSLWQPKINEWCVLWNNGNTVYTIVRYKSLSENNESFYSEKYWNNVAPLEFVKILRRFNYKKH